MFTAKHPLILASGSPRRRNMLASLGLAFTIIPPVVDETVKPDEDPAAYVRRMARIKSEAVANLHTDACVISADTIVLLENTVLGKPADQAAHLAMLQRLNGQTHLVMTALHLNFRAQQLDTQITRTTEVTFFSHSAETLANYVATGEGADKAGGYALQGKGVFLIASISGSPSNAIGMPLGELVSLLLEHRIIVSSS